MLAAALGAGCDLIDAPPVHAQDVEPEPELEATPPASQTAAIASCFLRTQEQTNLVDSQIRDLCMGTRTPDGPAVCFVVAEAELTLTDATMRMGNDNLLMLKSMNFGMTGSATF